MDHTADTASYVRRTQFAGGVQLVDNGNFEASTVLQGGAPPGWVASGATLSYETVAPQSGNQSLIVNAPAQFGNAQAKVKYLAKPGDAFQVGGFVFQTSNVGGAVQLIFLDMNGAQISSISAGTSTTGAWTQVSATGVAPANTVSAQLFCIVGGASGGIAKFDNVSAVLQLTPFQLTPVSTSGTPTSTTGLCTQSGTSTTILVAGSTWQFGSGQINYNSGSVNPGAFGTYYVYIDDPAYSGGAVTYAATTTPAVCNAATGRMVFGTITTSGAGGAVSTGGGSGGGGPRGKALLA